MIGYTAKKCVTNKFIGISTTYCDESPYVGRRQGFSNKNALRWPSNTAPIGFKCRCATQIVGQQHLRVRKLLPVIARLADRTITGRDSSLQPVQRTHLALTVQQVPAKRSQMIRQRPGKPVNALWLVDLNSTRLVQHDTMQR